jgi:predicted RecA/RadA family phage recombinase
MQYKQEGKYLDYTPTSAVSQGDVIVQGELVCVANRDIAANELGALAVEGVFALPKATISGSALTVGTKLYWDAVSDVVTTTSSSNKTVGYVATAAATDDATVDVKLGR